MDKNQPIITKYKKLTQKFTQDHPYAPKEDSKAPLLTTKNRKEYELRKLEKQQTKFLSSQWQKVDTYIKQKALIFETQRYPSYLDYDLMEYYPIIGQALDIFMEESTTANSEGRILNIFSENRKIQEELEELFFNRLNIHTTLPMWIRNTCKYGDNFVYMQIDDELGIVGAKQLPNIEVERIEGKENSRMKPSLLNQDDEVIFRWKATDVAEFKYWQVAHFRLLTDDKRLPYGVSVLEKARRIWKNLLLVEDAMRTIRLLRAIDRRVYYIDVGNIDPSDVQAYVEDIASRFKRKRHIDEYTGQEDLKYNVMGYDQDYFIPKRGAEDNTKIDTLAGASNIDQIADIEYDLNQLFAALGIPKPFLQYDAAAGEGKNLAMMDVRLAKKINRIQQSAVQELNKMAMVHLMLLGYDDELHNFELSLNNPSSQADVIRIEMLAARITAFKDAVSDAGKGISAMSYTMGMKEILGMTDDQVRLNLEQQFMETAVSEEIKAAASKISSSTIFDNIVKLYGIQATGLPAITPGAEGAEGADTGGGFGGGGGGGGGAGDLSSTLGASGGGAEMGGAEVGGAEMATPEAPAGGEIPAPEAAAPEAPAPEAPAEPLAESWNPQFENDVNENIEYLKRISDLIEKTKN
jgi:hypothetical protein